MKRLKTYLLMGLLLSGFASCITDTLDTNCSGVQGDEQDMYLRVSVPRTYASSGIDADKEKAIETLDMLVFAPNPMYPGQFSVKSASPGKVVEGVNRFEVVMPVGRDFIVHVFINSHDELVKQGFYNKAGRDMEVTLQELTTAISLNAAETKALPMHGYRAGVTITADMAGTSISIDALRSVSAVQIALNGKFNAETEEVDGADLIDEVTQKSRFKLHSLYTYFQSSDGRVAAAPDSYEKLAEGADDITRNVVKESLVKEPTVKVLADKEFIDVIPTKPYVTSYMYLYENKAYTTDGSDIPSETVKYATTRLVVGGVYKGDNPDNTTVTYYRVDITEGGKLVSLLRNHKYTFNITDVSGPGYDNPDDAAVGVPININIKVIDWVNELENVDFDRENYFYSQTKDIVLARTADATRTIDVASDVAVGEWQMSFADGHNGVTTPVTVAEDGKITPTKETTLKNDRFEITKSADGKKLTFKVRKAFSEVPTAPATRNDVFVIQVKNLRVLYNLRQVDKASDDWGNGGDLDTGVGDRTRTRQSNEETTDYK